MFASVWLRPPAVGSSEHKNVGRPADDLAPAKDFAFPFENSPMQPARSVDLRSRGEIRLKVRAILDHKFMSGFPECEGQRFAELVGNRLPQVVGGRAGERDRERARGLVTHAGVCSDIAEQVDPIDHECHAPQSIRERRMRQAPASDPRLPPLARIGSSGAYR